MVQLSLTQIAVCSILDFQRSLKVILWCKHLVVYFRRTVPGWRLRYSLRWTIGRQQLNCSPVPS